MLTELPPAPADPLGLSARAKELRRSSDRTTRAKEGPRTQKSADAKLASLVILTADGAAEPLRPKFSGDAKTYHNATPLPPDAASVTIVAAARNANAMVNVYRWDPAANLETCAAAAALPRSMCPLFRPSALAPPPRDPHPSYWTMPDSQQLRRRRTDFRPRHPTRAAGH